jgi:type II secretory pathway component HofQ
MKNSTNVHWRFLARVGAFCAAGAVLTATASGQDGPPGVRVSEYGRVDIAVQDTDLVQVLEMLSIQGRKNIIASPNVSATVSANLYDVTFYEALDAILRVNGYGYIEEGNFIYVYTQGELEQIGRTESRIFDLDYLSATGVCEHC